MAKKKILHIQVFPKLSGVQKISLEILKALPNEEFEKHILFCKNSDCGDQSECIRAFENAGVKVMFSKHLKREIGFQDIPAYFEIYHLCRREEYDIVHTNSTKPGIVGRLAAYCARVPHVIHTVHGLAFHSLIKFPYWHFYYGCEMFASYTMDLTFRSSLRCHCIDQMMRMSPFYSLEDWIFLRIPWGY